MCAVTDTSTVRARHYVRALKQQVGGATGIMDVDLDETNGLVVFTTITGKNYGISIAEFLAVYALQN